MQNISCSGFTELPVLHYIPRIEDIFVGYQAEFNWCDIGGLVILDCDSNESETIYEPTTKLWEPIVCGYPETIFEIKMTPETFYNVLKEGGIRTPYLTPIQIEKEGWNSWRGTGDVTPYNLLLCWGVYKFEKPNYTLIFRWSDHSMTIYKKNTYYFASRGNNDNEKVYKGKCPSINELRKIMELLNIK